MKGGVKFLNKMGNIITTISYSAEIERYIRENKIKPSKIIQDHVVNLMESEKISNKQVSEMTRRIAFLQETINKQRNFIEAKGLMEKFLQNV